LLTESLLLSVLGGALGLLFAVWGGELISAVVPDDVPRFKEAGLDRAVLGFTSVASVMTGIIFGLAPALQTSKIDLNEALKESGRSATEGRRGHRVRSLLIVSEVALSLVLLVGAGLLIKSFLHLRSTNPGFNPQRVLTASVSLPSVKYAKDEQLVGFYQQLAERVSQLPGVEAASAILGLPFGDSFIRTSFTVAGQRDPGPGARPIAGGIIVTPDYFRALGVPIIKGRVFTERDTAEAPKVLLINETLARRFFPGEDPIGKYLDLGLNDIHGMIVGVVGDVHQRRLDAEVEPAYYVPYQQVPINSMSLVVRTKTDDPMSLAAPLRAAVQGLDKEVPLFQVHPMESLVADSIARQRFSMTLLAAFAGLALALTAVGIFSVMSFLVAQRTHELGIRMTLGAQASDVLKLVVGQGMIFALIGVAIGVAAALSLTHLMATLLYGVSPTDPATFIVITLLLVSVALVACYIPARRATRVDPMVALRYE
jgi:putative ABC transport system permease protein